MNFDLIELKELVLMDKAKYPEVLKTERLLLKKANETDATTVLYSINLNDEKKKKIGEIVLIFDGEIWYRIDDEEDRHKGYITEAMKKVLKVSHKKHHLVIEKDNKYSKKVAKKLGFKKTCEKRENANIYRKST